MRESKGPTFQLADSQRYNKETLDVPSSRCNEAEPQQWQMKDNLY